MELTRKRVSMVSGASRVAGLAAVACAACCAPLIAPLLAWPGLAGLTFMGQYGVLGAALGAVAIGVLIMQRQRRLKRQSSIPCAGSDCASSCAAQPGNPAPIACTLSPADFKERAQWLRELTDRALIAHQLGALSVHLYYRRDMADDVERMVRQERECCAFLSFDLRRTATSVEVIVTAPAEAADDARILFAHLMPA